MAYDNTNKGSIWKNEKRTSEDSPDFTGSLNVEGREFWFNAWKRKEGANEKAPALSFSIKLKEAKAPYKVEPPAKSAPAKGASFDDMDNDLIPF